MPFTFQPLEIPDVIKIKSQCFEDSRGFFCETYHQKSFQEAGIDHQFVQDNYSLSTAKVLRGMHFQRPPLAQGKLIWTIDGEIFDVAVDLRPDSPTYGRWVGAHLSASSYQLLWIPPGFAHGFLTLSPKVHLHYKCTAPYSPQHEGGFRWDDPAVAIDWPFRDVNVSERDANLPLLSTLE